MHIYIFIYMLIKCIFGIITQCFYPKQISSSVNQSGKNMQQKKIIYFIYQ